PFRESSVPGAPGEGPERPGYASAGRRASHRRGVRDQLIGVAGVAPGKSEQNSSQPGRELVVEWTAQL
ncbi:MAG: hypothetical protein ACRDQX_08790, partial [Pseudonocardiaceae bacterium]